MAAQAHSTRRRARETTRPAVVLEIPANPSWLSRNRIEALIEQLVVALDRIDGESDFEPSVGFDEVERDYVDDEPDLASCDIETATEIYAPTFDCDREVEAA